MRVLSLTQPWASLMAIGAKRIETRSWSTSYRGLVAIHAAKNWPIECVNLCATSPFVEVLRHGIGLDAADVLDAARGRIVAVVELVDCLSTEGLLLRHAIATPAAPFEHAFGDYSPRRFGWVTRNVVRLREPVEHRGAQGLRGLPPDVEARVRAQMERR